MMKNPRRKKNETDWIHHHHRKSIKKPTKMQTNNNLSSLKLYCTVRAKDTKVYSFWKWLVSNCSIQEKKIKYIYVLHNHVSRAEKKNQVYSFALSRRVCIWFDNATWKRNLFRTKICFFYTRVSERVKERKTEWMKNHSSTSLINNHIIT